MPSFRWQSFEPRLASWIDYDRDIAKQLEAQFQANQPHLDVKLAGKDFRIYLAEGSMRQENARGLARKVRRVDLAEATSFHAGDQVEAWCNSQQAWCRGVVEKVNGGMIVTTLQSPAGETLKKELPVGSEDIRHVGTEPKRSAMRDFSVGDTVEVWCNSQRAWCKGVVERIVDGMVCTSFLSPAGDKLTKNVPADHDGIRYAKHGVSEDPICPFTVGQDVEVYSKSRQMWCQGLVHKIENSCVVVELHAPGTDTKPDEVLRKTLGFNSSEIRPLRRRINTPEAPLSEATPQKHRIRSPEVALPDATPHVDSVRPALWMKGTWQAYEPAERTVLVIGPGGGTRANESAYKSLQKHGWDVTTIHASDYDVDPQGSGTYLYPPGWEIGEPDLSMNRGKNLATLADNVVMAKLNQLVKEGRGPAAVIAGSRGGQVTLPRLWKCGWRGPTLVINGGCVDTTAIPGAPVRLVLFTGGRDNFATRDPQHTARALRKDDNDCPVLLYHDPSEGHMPRRLGDVLRPLMELVVSQEKFMSTSRAASEGKKACLPQDKIAFQCL